MIYFLVGALIISLIILFFTRIISSENFVKSYCLTLFKKRQAIFLKSFNDDLRLHTFDPKEDQHKQTLEMLQDRLWTKSKEFDKSICSGIFNIDLVMDIAYIVWLIYFVNLSHDGS